MYDTKHAVVIQFFLRGKTIAPIIGAMKQAELPKTLSLKQVAKILGRPMPTIYAWQQSGALKVIPKRTICRAEEKGIRVETSWLMQEAGLTESQVLAGL